MQSVEVLFNEAITKDELAEYLGGFAGYEVENPYGDTPTDFGGIFTPIRIHSKDDHELQVKVVDAVKSLAHNPELGWGAIFHIGNLAQLKRLQGIDLLSFELINSVAESLRKNKAAFVALKRWEGKNHEDGVWALVRNKNRNLHNDYGITVLPEEL